MLGVTQKKEHNIGLTVIDLNWLDNVSVCYCEDSVEPTVGLAGEFLDFYSIHWTPSGQTSQVPLGTDQNS